MGCDFKTDRILQIEDHKNGMFGIRGEGGNVTVVIKDGGLAWGQGNSIPKIPRVAWRCSSTIPP